MSWSSHLDIADVASVLLSDSSVTGVVSVGLLPAITGSEPAEAFSRYFGHTIRYESITSQEFGKKLAVLFGEAAANEVADAYEAKAKTRDSAIDTHTSAQSLLGLSPRTVEQWLHEIKI